MHELNSMQTDCTLEQLDLTAGIAEHLDHINDGVLYMESDSESDEENHDSVCDMTESQEDVRSPVHDCLMSLAWQQQQQQEENSESNEHTEDADDNVDDNYAEVGDDKENIHATAIHHSDESEINRTVCNQHEYLRIPTQYLATIDKQCVSDASLAETFTCTKCRCFLNNDERERYNKLISVQTTYAYCFQLIRA